LTHGPLVSIITRTYEAPGRHQLLAQAGRSVANQTYRDIEWIVVQDGGESQREVADAVGASAPWMTVRFVAGRRRGRSFAGNAGMEAASGDYCLFLDDDDLLYADHVETLVAALKRRTEACAAYALSFEVRSECTETGCEEEPYTTPAHFHQPWDYAVLLDHNFIPIQSLLFSRKLFLERGGFDTDLEQLEDWNLWLRYGFGNTFEFVPKTTSLFRTPSNPEIRLRRHLDLHRAYEEAKGRASASITTALDLIRK
jgi:GT2 family glycosyltransferase